MNLHRIGLIVNPSAGRGEGMRIARQAVRALAPDELLVGAGEMGADALTDLPVRPRIFDWTPHTGRARTKFLAEQFALERLDALVVVGGDGTLADVAIAGHVGAGLVPARPGQAQGLPLLGIGVGSANVGPLITCRGDQVERLAQAQLRVRAVDGLIAGANDAPLGLGFNDVVIGFTVLATIDGAIVDVDAVGKMRGQNIPREAKPVWTEHTRVVKVSRSAPSRETIVAQGDQVATVIVGFADDRFYGKAIAGGVLLSGLLNDPAGCLVCDHLLVRMKMDVAEYRRSEPVVSRYVSLGEAEQIEGWNFRAGSVLCADGNPLAVLNESDRIQVTVQRALAHSLQVEEPV